mmetsp:Transcript_28745/g.80357  ORF Transcript_28745/g.80357 Transcript_28745/m.80357 type:complete len:216 (-) Transcript_28745:2445-3092(-)
MLQFARVQFRLPRAGEVLCRHPNTKDQNPALKTVFHKKKLVRLRGHRAKLVSDGQAVETNGKLDFCRPDGRYVDTGELHVDPPPRVGLSHKLPRPCRRFLTIFIRKYVHHRIPFDPRVQLRELRRADGLTGPVHLWLLRERTPLVEVRLHAVGAALTPAASVHLRKGGLLRERRLREFARLLRLVPRLHGWERFRTHRPARAPPQQLLFTNPWAR